MSRAFNLRSSQKTRFIGRVKHCFYYILVTALSGLPQIGVAQSAMSIQLQIDDANPGDGRVHFRSGTCDVAQAPSAQTLLQMSRGETPNYVLFVDVSKTSLLYGSFVYEFYVEHKSAMPSLQLCVFRVQATPTGTFVDQVSDLTFHLKEEDRPVEDGTITVALHNSSYKQAILQAQPPAPFA
jgi:hypothetical protein